MQEHNQRLKEPRVHHFVEASERGTEFINFSKARRLVKEAAFIGLDIVGDTVQSLVTGSAANQPKY